MKLTKKFIKENPEMKLKELLKPKEPFTGWAKDKRGGINMHWLGYIENDILIYGVDADGLWFDKRPEIVECAEFNKPATPEEIKNDLEKEAVKRGFKEGLKVMPLWETPKTHWEVYNNQTRFDEKSNSFYFGCCIFQNGTWATIIKPKQMTIQEIEKEFNIEVI